MNVSETAIDSEALEVRRLMQGVFRRYGFDFREYSEPSLRRRVRNRLRGRAEAPRV